MLCPDGSEPIGLSSEEDGFIGTNPIDVSLGLSGSGANVSISQGSVIVLRENCDGSEVVDLMNLQLSVFAGSGITVELYGPGGNLITQVVSWRRTIQYFHFSSLVVRNLDGKLCL